MEGSAPVPLSLSEALAGLQMEDPRTPKKISLDGEEGGKPGEPGCSPGSVAATTAGGSEAAQCTPQKIELPAEVTDWPPCGPPPGLPELSAAEPGKVAAQETPGAVGGGIMGTTPMDMSACGLPFYEACGMQPSMFGSPATAPSPCSPYALFGPEYYADTVQAMGEAEHFMSLFQGLMRDGPAAAAAAAGPTDTFQQLSTMAEETSDPVLAALAATSPMRPKEVKEEPKPGALDAPPGLPMPSSRQPPAAACTPSKAAPPGLEGWASDDSTASPASSDATDLPSAASCQDLTASSPAAESFAMSPEAAPFVPSLAGLVTAPLDPLAVLATAPPAPVVPAVAVKEAAEEDEEAKHGAGSCRPCAWFWKEVGCASGKDCEYCHACPKGALKARKKVKRAMIRIGQAPSPGVQEALTPSPGSSNFVLSLSALL